MRHRKSPLLAGPLAAIMLAGASVSVASADYSLDWEASTTAVASTGRFAPTLVSAGRAGLIIDGRTLQEQGKIWRPLSTATRFSYGFGANVAFTASNAVAYDRYVAATDDNPGHWTARGLRPAWARVQELYGEIKFRGVYIFAGMKENDRSIFDSPLSTGDITLSDNARPIPQVRVGFIDFQNIPLTNGWVQIQGDIAYGRFLDSDWLREHNNEYNFFVTTGNWYHYKRCYFRTKPSKLFSVTVGMQHACQFGGTWQRYREGVLYESHHDPVDLKQLLQIFYQPKGNGSSIDSEAINFVGNHLGSWDVRMRYRFRNDATLTFYMQKPWEDESGVAWQNGFDGVWGLEYKAASPAWIDGADLEYIDFTNHAGPILWDLRDHPDTTIENPGKATGADDYYNNFMYNGWANYGQAIGSPLFKAPVYNTDGFMQYVDNNLRGVHIGLGGTVLPADGLTWRLRATWLSSNGTPNLPRLKTDHLYAVSAEADWNLPRVKGLTLSAQLALDAGSLYQPTFGALFKATYSGALNFKKNGK